MCRSALFERTTKATKMRSSPKDEESTWVCQKTRTFGKSQIFRTPGHKYRIPVGQKGVKLMFYLTSYSVIGYFQSLFDVVEHSTLLLIDLLIAVRRQIQKVFIEITLCI